MTQRAADPDLAGMIAARLAGEERTPNPIGTVTATVDSPRHNPQRSTPSVTAIAPRRFVQRATPLPVRGAILTKVNVQCRPIMTQGAMLPLSSP